MKWLPNEQRGVPSGYDPYAVIDASGTWYKMVQDVTTHHLTQVGAKATTWVSVKAEFMHDWRDEKSMELGGVLGQFTSYGWTYESYLSSVKQRK